MSSIAEYHDRSGWCLPCRIVWAWKGDPCGREAFCPRCSQPLTRKPHCIRERHIVRDVDSIELHALLRGVARVRA